LGFAPRWSGPRKTKPSWFNPRRGARGSGGGGFRVNPFFGKNPQLGGKTAPQTPWWETALARAFRLSPADQCFYDRFRGAPPYFPRKGGRLQLGAPADGGQNGLPGKTLWKQKKKKIRGGRPFRDRGKELQGIWLTQGGPAGFSLPTGFSQKRGAARGGTAGRFVVNGPKSTTGHFRSV